MATNKDAPNRVAAMKGVRCFWPWGPLCIDDLAHDQYVIEMTYLHGRILKRIDLNDGSCVDIVARQDGAFQFFHRTPCDDKSARAVCLESGTYISAETAEAAARLKFKL